MSGRTRKIDPATGDYVKTADGSGFVYITTLATALYHQINGHLDKWWGDPSAGSLNYLITTRHTSDEDISLARNAMLTALQRFVDIGRARDPSVVMSRSPNRVGMETRIDSGGVPITTRSKRSAATAAASHRRMASSKQP